MKFIGLIRMFNERVIIEFNL